MKLAKISLAAAVALGALSTASFAQPLEEAIKGVDVGGWLRYRYNDDTYKNKVFKENDRRSDTKHYWRANLDFKAPIADGVAFNLGVTYNANSTTNTGDHANKGTALSTFGGNGLGREADKGFGVATYFATITPGSTKTTINVGKMRLASPITDPNDDRFTGILALNSDVPNWTFAGALFDSWSLDDGIAPLGDATINKNIYALAALGNYGDFSAQAWFFNIADTVKALFFGELAYKQEFFNVKGQFIHADLNNGEKGLFGPNILGKHEKKNSLFTAEAGVTLKPVDFKVGYIGSLGKGYAVALDNEGTISKAGKLWFDNAATAVSFGAVNSNRTPVLLGQKDKLKVIYAAAGVSPMDGLRVGIEGVTGEAKFTGAHKAKEQKRKFTEITPVFSYKYSKKLTLSGFYAMLTTKLDGGDVKEKRNRTRFEARYNF